MPRRGELCAAAEHANVAEVKRLLADGANIEEKDLVSGGALQRGFGCHPGLSKSRGPF